MIVSLSVEYKRSQSYGKRMCAKFTIEVTRMLCGMGSSTLDLSKLGPRESYSFGANMARSAASVSSNGIAFASKILSLPASHFSLRAFGCIYNNGK